MYHLTFFRAINPAALAFGVAFIAPAALFAAFGFGMWEDLGLPVAGITALAAWWPARTRREAGMTTKRQFSAAEARSIGTRLGIDWSEIDLEQFRRGLAVELEHGAHDPQTNVTNDDLDLTGKIAWAHLKEVRDYYTRLEAMEAAAESR